MITAEREVTSRLIALTEDSQILGYTETGDPKKFLRELRGGHKLAYQLRIYDVCPSEITDLDHYYDFEAKCLLRREPSEMRKD